jgi:amidophosphoribosyltransferase
MTDFPIRELPLAERPRERLLEHGGRALSDSELLAVLLRTGKIGRSAIQLAKDLLRESGGLAGLLGSTPHTLRRNGIGPAKAASLLAAVEIGRRLAREYPVEADLVIPVPESGTPAAIGYAEESGIPYGQGLVKNSYVGRTFIQPSQTIRQLGIRLKLNPLRDVIEGKRLVVVDDSIVRGNTQRALIRMLREAGAREVHVRISSPPVKWPCFYGIDFATRAELIANGLSTDEIARSIDADSLGYVSLDELVEATTVPKESLCRACFDGVYPVKLPDPEHLGKHLLELSDITDADGLRASVGGGGAPDSLDRP